MNDQDRDLIAALAEGRLDTDAVEAAIARIDSDPELSSEYAHQVAALEFLATGAAPRMSASERTTLHANLTEQLGFVAAPVPIAAPAKRRTPWWAPVFGLATAAAVVAAVVILPGGSADQSADTAGEAFASSDTTAATESAAEPPAGGADAATEEVAVAEDGGISVFETDDANIDELLGETEGAESTDEIQLRLADLSFKSTVDLDADKINSCIDELANDIPPGVDVIRILGASVEADETIVHLGFDYGDGVEDGLSFVIDDCSLVRHADQG